QAEDGIRDFHVTGVQTCALPILIYHNFKNPYMGSNTALYGHYNFYFFNRSLMFRVGQKIAFAEKPYDKEDNYRNVAFGSTVLSRSEERRVGKGCSCRRDAKG